MNETSWTPGPWEADAIYSVSDMHLGNAAITVEDVHRAAALLSRSCGDVA